MNSRKLADVDPDALHWTSRALHRVGVAVANSTAGVAAATMIGVWTIVGAVIGFPQWWLTVLYAVTASITFVMVFVIQHTQSRQTFATQRKLDELIRATHTADDTLISVEQAPEGTLQALADRNAADRAKALGSAQVGDLG
jgi:low affinity Fe/Cu permease